MSSVGTQVDEPLNGRVREFRRLLSEDPGVGAIYDPPSVHFSHQVASDYDWQAIEPALEEFAARTKPFEARTIGLVLFGGTLVAGVRPDPRLVDYTPAYGRSSRRMRRTVSLPMHPTHGCRT